MSKDWTKSHHTYSIGKTSVVKHLRLFPTMGIWHHYRWSTVNIVENGQMTGKRRTVGRMGVLGATGFQNA